MSKSCVREGRVTRDVQGTRERGSGSIAKLKLRVRRTEQLWRAKLSSYSPSPTDPTASPAPLCQHSPPSPPAALTFKVLSSDPDARYFTSGEKDTEYTESLCPSNLSISLPVLMSHSLPDPRHSFPLLLPALLLLPHEPVQGSGRDVPAVRADRY
eukprot:768100-Hanusia_phi.AAC.9